MKHTASPASPASEIYALCARCDSASLAASESLAALAAQTGPRKRAQWRREHTGRLIRLDSAANALVRALHVQPFAADAVPAAARQYAERVLTHAGRQIDVLTAHA